MDGNIQARQMNSKISYYTNYDTNLDHELDTDIRILADRWKAFANKAVFYFGDRVQQVYR